MAVIPLIVTAGPAARMRSLEAYVLPHLVDVTAGAPGIVTSVDVVPRALVLRGQGIATLLPDEPRREGEHGALVVKAPVTGVVTRCWAAVAETVRRASPVVSIASSENVLVSAKFPAGCSGRLQRDATAVVLRGRARAPIAAEIVNVITPSECERDGPADVHSTRVVLSLLDAPPDVLWPGTPVEVVVFEA